MSPILARAAAHDYPGRPVLIEPAVTFGEHAERIARAGGNAEQLSIATGRPLAECVAAMKIELARRAAT